MSLKTPTSIKTTYDPENNRITMNFEEEHIMFLLKKFHEIKRPVVMSIDAPEDFKKISLNRSAPDRFREIPVVNVMATPSPRLDRKIDNQIKEKIRKTAGDKSEKKLSWEK